MISFEEAVALILAAADPLGTVQIGIDQSAGYVLAEAVRTPMPLPRFDSSSVDGFGVLANDTNGASASAPVRLQVVGTIAAGEKATTPLVPGSAFKISTGGRIPKGVNAVIQREQVREGEWITVAQPVSPGMNIRRAGEEFRAGDRVLAAHSRITPPVIGLLAYLGVSSCMCFRKPSVTLIITGSELVSAGGLLESGQVYDSNGPALSTALRTSGILDLKTERVSDSPDALRQCVQNALATSDVVITSGGVSMGDQDFVRQVFSSVGIRQVFWRVEMKPGKPNYFGVYASRAGESKRIFGLPGNPASALVSYLKLVKPALRKMMGEQLVSPELTPARLTSEVRKERGKLEFRRGRLTIADGIWLVMPIDRQGSHMLGGMAEADCLIHCPADQEFIASGEAVLVQRIEW